MRNFNFKIGQKFTSIKQICEFVGLEYKDSTGSRDAILKEVGQYVNLEKKGRTHTVTEIYQEPKEKIDGRGKSEGSRNNNQIYSPHIDPILTDYFGNTDGFITYVTINQLAESAGIFNDNYREALANKQKVVNTLKKDMGVSNEVALNNVLYSINDIRKSIITSSLYRLQREGIIKYSSGYILHEQYTGEDNEDKVEIRFADDDEEKIIQQCENDILGSMNIEKSYLYGDDNLRVEYYNRLNELIFSRIKNISLCYMGFEVLIVTKEKLDAEVVNNHIIELNKVVKERVKDRNIRRKGKTETKSNEVAFGEPNLKEYEVGIMQDDYLKDTDVIIEYLLGLNHSVLKMTSQDCLGDDVELNVTISVANIDAEVTGATESNEEIVEIDTVIEMQQDRDLGQYENKPIIWEFNVSSSSNKVKEKKERVKTKYDWLYEDTVGSGLPIENFIKYDAGTGKYIFM